jgi:DNA-binding transcriptional ArsR family regulator
MNKRDILSLDIRHKIYNFMKKNPGLHLRKISRELNIPKTTLMYHITILEEHDLISTSIKEGYARFYIIRNVSYRYKKVLDFLRNNTTRNILLLILLYKISSRKEISNELGMHPNSISFQLKKLLDNNLIEPAPFEDGYYKFVLEPKDKSEGLIKRNQNGREKFYRLSMSAIDPIYEAFIIYQDVLFEDSSIIKSVVDIMNIALESDHSIKTPEKIDIDNEDRRDKLIEMIFKIFPVPWCA